MSEITTVAIDCDRCRRYLADVHPPAPPVPVLCPKCAREVQADKGCRNYDGGFLIGPDPIKPMQFEDELPLPDGAA